MAFKPVKSDEGQVNFAAEELRVLELWNRIDAFKRSIREKSADKSFIFYDGPPFATGKPHYGHLVASALKDIVPRYWTMRGYRVERRFGWDTHGLPIEQQIQEKLNLDSPRAIKEFGVDKFNETCRANVLTYVDEWRRTITRVGRWVDFDDDYKTMDKPFMESVWWAFSELWKKGLVYAGRRVMPYSWALATPLSNFEAGQDYRDVDDPALTVRLKVDGDDLELLIWTTTPWTLPSNLAVAVGADIDYVKAKHKDGHTYVVAKDLAKSVLGDEHEVLSTLKGKELVGLKYTPLFPFFAERKAKGAFRVIASGHVTTTDGTGLVHMAPAFGEDDFEACKREGIDIVEPVDEEGRFTKEVPPWSGKRVKEADPEIAHALKENGNLFKRGTIKHSYPFCYRTGTPLIYKTTPSWYVRVEPLRERMVANNATIHWVPDFVGEKRFDNWLKDARDWSISRSRFWGTPIPLWQCAKCKEFTCIGSVAELEERSGAKLDDIHPHKIDWLEIVCAHCSDGRAKRISDVFDCWFESGSMPYAQQHYPFERRDHFEKNFPAQFIAEGLDQTRGWFYTLLVLSTALFDKAPFQNCIVNGLVLAKTYQDPNGKRWPLADVDEKGGKAFLKSSGAELRVMAEKMSKRLQNYPDPHVVIDQYGADALRAYLINSPVVRAEPLAFDEKGVRDVVRTVLLPLQNAWSFFVTYANIDNWHPSDVDKAPALKDRAEIDRWILSVLQSLVRDVNAQMEGYYLDRVVPPMLGFIDDLTNWYIRRSRRRFWKSANDADKASAYSTLYEVLTTFARVLAPVLPFVAESVYQNLVVEPLGRAVASSPAPAEPDAGPPPKTSGVKNVPASVHLCDYPLVDAAKIDANLERQMHEVRRVVVLGRALREKHKMKTRQPLARATVVSHNADVRAAIEAHRALLLDELNVKNVDVVKDDAGLASLSFKANFKTLGKRAGPKMKSIAAAIESFTREQFAKLEDGGSVDVDGVSVALADVLVTRTARGDVVVESEGDVTIALDTVITPELKLENGFRELTTEVNALRKKDGLEVHDRVAVSLFVDDADFAKYLGGRSGDVAGEVTASSVSVSTSTAPAEARMIEAGEWRVGVVIEAKRS
jgi:isoleucyl-tRNA synthetase